MRLEGENLVSGWSQVPGAKLPPARTPLACGRSSQSEREPLPHPCRSRVLSLPAGHLLPQGLCGRWQRQGGHRGLARGSLPWPRDWLPLCPPFPSCGRPRARAPSAAPAAVLPHHATLGCAVPRGAPSSGLIPLLGRKEEPRDRRGTKAVVWAPSRQRSPLKEGGSPRGRRGAGAAVLGRGKAGVLRLPAYPRLPSSASRLPATTALRRPAPSRPASPPATLPRSPAPGRRARPAPPRARAHTRATHTRARARSAHA